MRHTLCFVAVLICIACGPSPTIPSATSAPIPSLPPPYSGPMIVTHGQLTGPQPTVITLALDAQGSWTPPFSTIADHLVARGWLGVSLDLPAHGADVRPGETPDPMLALASWRTRIAAGEDVVGDFTRELRTVVDGLVQSKMSSAIVVVGISRGALLAVHAAATDARIGGVALFIPVTDLSVLDEFVGLEHDPRVTSVAALPLAFRLSRTPLFLETSETDIRIDATRAVAFAEAVRGFGDTVALHIELTNLHVLPESAMQEAADFLAAQRR